MEYDCWNWGELIDDDDPPQPAVATNTTTALKDDRKNLSRAQKAGCRPGEMERQRSAQRIDSTDRRLRSYSAISRIAQAARKLLAAASERRDRASSRFVQCLRGAILERRGHQSRFANFEAATPLTKKVFG